MKSSTAWPPLPQAGAKHLGGVPSGKRIPVSQLSDGLGLTTNILPSPPRCCFLLKLSWTWFQWHLAALPGRGKSSTAILGGLIVATMVLIDVQPPSCPLSPRWHEYAYCALCLPRIRGNATVGLLPPAQHLLETSLASEASLLSVQAQEQPQSFAWLSPARSVLPCCKAWMRHFLLSTKTARSVR
jgi:hypothetical protein